MFAAAAGGLSNFTPKNVVIGSQSTKGTKKQLMENYFNKDSATPQAGQPPKPSSQQRDVIVRKGSYKNMLRPETPTANKTPTNATHSRTNGSQVIAAANTNIQDHQQPSSKLRSSSVVNGNTNNITESTDIASNNGPHTRFAGRHGRDCTSNDARIPQPNNHLNKVHTMGNSLGKKSLNVSHFNDSLHELNLTLGKTGK